MTMDDKPLKPLGVRTKAHERAVRTVRLLQAERDGWRLKAEGLEKERNNLRVDHADAARARDAAAARAQSAEAKLRDKDDQRVREETRANKAESELRRANLALVAALIGGGR